MGRNILPRQCYQEPPLNIQKWAQGLIQQNILKRQLIKTYILMFKPKNNLKQTCDRHHFSLKPKSQHVQRPQNLSISFCKEQCGEYHTSKHVKRANSCLNCPTFNKDSNYGSPTFILRSQKKYYQQKKDKIQTEHQQKYLQYTDQKSSINLPKPKSKTNYCAVCQANYEDYLQHIQNPFHLGKIKKSGFNSHIHELANIFKQKIKKQIIINSESKKVVMDVNDSEDQQIVEKTRKKIKEDCNTPYTTQTIQNSQPFSFCTPTPFEYLKQLTELYQHQLAINTYWNYLNHTFSIFPQQNPNVFNYSTISYSPIPSLDQLSKPKEVNPTQNPIHYIVIDD